MIFYGIITYFLIGVVVTLLIMRHAIETEKDYRYDGSYYLFLMVWPIVAIIATIVAIGTFVTKYMNFLKVASKWMESKR